MYTLTNITPFLRAPIHCSCCIVANLCLIFHDPWTAAHQASLSFTISQSLLKLMSIESMIPYNHLILCHPPFPPALNLSQPQGLFQWVDSSDQMAKLLELQLLHQCFQWIFWLIFFRIDWFDLLAFQGTLKSLLQLHNLKVSMLQCSAFLMVQTVTSIHPVVTTGKTIALIIWTFFNKVMSLLFSHEVKVCHSFFPKEKAFINVMATVTTHRDFGAFKNKIHHRSHFFPIYLPWSDVMWWMIDESYDECC